MFTRRPDGSSPRSDGESEDTSPTQHKSLHRRFKRERSSSSYFSDKDEEDLANCLVLLSNSGTPVGGEDDHRQGDGRGKSVNKGKTGPAFQCKACKKVFTSHQALGGHRASHKKVKGCFASEDKEEDDEEEEEEYEEDDDDDEEDEDEDEDDEEREKSTAQITKKGSNAHECTICHRVFASGQALGGHKRCHWLTPSNAVRTATSLRGDAEESPVGSKRRASDRPSLDLNLACPEYSVDRTVMKVQTVGGGGGTNNSSSWLQLASGDWF